MHVCVRASIAILVALWIAPSALALPAGYALQIDITDSSTGSSLGGADLGTLMGLGMLTETVDTTAGITTLELNGPVSGPSGGWTIQDWDSSVKEDPWLTNNFTVSNNTGATKTYTISVSSPIPAFNADTIIQSTIQLRLLDSNSTGGATTTSQPGIDVYQGIVNGTTELALLTDPFSLTCANPVDWTLNGTATAGVVSQPPTSISPSSCPPPQPAWPAYRRNGSSWRTSSSSASLCVAKYSPGMTSVSARCSCVCRAISGPGTGPFPHFSNRLIARSIEHQAQRAIVVVVDHQHDGA